MKIVRAFAVSSVLAGSILGAACVSTVDSAIQAEEDDGVAVSALGNSSSGNPQDRGHGGGGGPRAKGESSPYIVGDWKFDQKQTGTQCAPTADTEFRFINPTADTFTLEYAFFELDGTFCGCDREQIHHNETIAYTVFQEKEEGHFTCSGKSGALKSIVFKLRNHKLHLDDAMQVGFQTHAFGDIREPAEDSSEFLLGSVMTESGMKGIAINDSTLEEIRNIHQQCVAFLPPDGD